MFWGRSETTREGCQGPLGIEAGHKFYSIIRAKKLQCGSKVPVVLWKCTKACAQMTADILSCKCEAGPASERTRGRRFKDVVVEGAVQLWNKLNKFWKWHLSPLWPAFERKALKGRKQGKDPTSTLSPCRTCLVLGLDLKHGMLFSLTVLTIPVVPSHVCVCVTISPWRVHLTCNTATQMTVRNVSAARWFWTLLSSLLHAQVYEYELCRKCSEHDNLVREELSLLVWTPLPPPKKKSKPEGCLTRTCASIWPESETNDLQE